jgi:flagellar biogenesis protein FliO
MDGAVRAWICFGRCCVTVALAAAALGASGDVTDSKPGAAASRYDSIELRPRANSSEAKSAGGSDQASGATEATRVIVALGAVIGLIFAVRWAGRRFLGMNGMGTAGGSAGTAVRVLSRTTLSPKQQLMLVQVGKRLVLVANTGLQMNALCEIADPEEVASLLGEVQAKPDRLVGAAGSFLTAFGRAGNTYDEDPRPARQPVSINHELEDSSVVPPTRQELAGLLDKVRLMSGAFRKS